MPRINFSSATFDFLEPGCLDAEPALSREAVDLVLQRPVLAAGEDQVEVTVDGSGGTGDAPEDEPDGGLGY